MLRVKIPEQNENSKLKDHKKTIERAKRDFLDYINNTNTNLDLLKIRDALDFAIDAHKDQKRASGEPYVTHPIAVAKFVASLKLDTTSIIVALLHDVVEDTQYTLHDIEKKFGKKEAKLVDGVTKLGKLKAQSENAKQAENLRKLLLAISNDIRVLLVKLADRLHNMHTLHYIENPEKRKRIAQETFDIYAPLAERIGLQKFKNELQDLAFAELYPEIRTSITNRLHYLHKKGKFIVEETILKIKELLKNASIKADVTGREKVPHSIWRKMEYKKISFEALSDIVAFRIIVDSIEDCYKVLGIIHQKYVVIPNTFQDYISNPKSNGYQSLHTVVMGPQNRVIEIQVRTHEMHEVAEFGVAAHWMYKQNLPFNANNKQYKWLKELYKIIEDSSNPDVMLENAKLEMSYNQVFAFTPKGELISLPEFSTPLDFAFALHSDFGLHYAGAKVNGKIVPIKTQLENGDQVEILKGDVPVIDSSWEEIVVSGRAKSAIKKFLRNKQNEELVNLGRVILIKNMRKASLSYNEKELITLLPLFNKNNLNTFLLDIAKGLILTDEIINIYQNKFNKKGKNKFHNFLDIFKFLRIRNKREQDLGGLKIDGAAQNTTIQLADCCCPIPGDKIVGIHLEHTIMVHTSDCGAIEEMNRRKKNNAVNLVWTENRKHLYIVRMKVTLLNESGSLVNVLYTIAKLNMNIANIKVIAKSLDFFDLLIDLELRSKEDIQKVINNVKRLDNVYEIQRFKGQRF